MPIFSVTTTPVQISQVITQASLIQNTGDANVYLGIDSSVSIASYDVVLGPRSSITWQPDTTLWAATATGNASTLSVMYGAEAATLGEVSVIGTVDIDGDVTLDGPVQIDGPVTVNGTVDVGNVVHTEIDNTVTTTVSGTVDTVVTAPVTIDGPVDVSGSDVAITGPVNVTGSVDASGSTIDVGTINTTVTIDGTVAVDLPVNVQGGGTLLHNSTVDLPVGGQQVINIDGPADGLTYYGTLICLTLQTAFTARDTLVPYDVFFGASTTSYSGALYYPDTGDNWFGLPFRHYFTIPTLQDYPLSIQITNRTGASSARVLVQAYGVSVADAFPRTDFSTNWQTGSSTLQYIAEFPWDANHYIWLPPSYQDYKVRCYQGASSSLTSVQLDTVNLATGAQERLATQIQNQIPGTSFTDVTAQSSVIFDIPGNGVPTALYSSSSGNTGLGYLTLYGPDC